MAVSEPCPRADLLHPEQIANQRFMVAKRGYETDEVEAYLHDLAEGVERMHGELEWLRARAEHLERRSVSAQEAAYARLARDFTSAIKTADEAARQVLADARREGDAIVAQARAEAFAPVPSTPPRPVDAEDPWSRVWQTERPAMRATRSTNGSTVTPVPAAADPTGDLDLDLGIEDSLSHLFDGLDRGDPE